MGMCQKVPKFSMSKIIRIFLNFFFHWRISILEHIFFFWHFLITSIFKSLYLLKSCPIFDTSPLTQFSKFNNFLWVCWFLGKNLSNFVPPVWKLHNPYCHIEDHAWTLKLNPLNSVFIKKTDKLGLYSGKSPRNLLSHHLVFQFKNLSRPHALPAPYTLMMIGPTR